MNFVNRVAELVIPDSILVLDADGNLVNEKSNEKPLGGAQHQINENDSQENESNSNSKCIIALNNNKIIDEAKRKRRFESMMVDSEDEDKIVENKDSNQNSICTRE